MASIDDTLRADQIRQIWLDRGSPKEARKILDEIEDEDLQLEMMTGYMEGIIMAQRTAR